MTRYGRNCCLFEVSMAESAMSKIRNEVWPAGHDVHLTRTGAGSIDYRVTISDENEWTGPWMALMPMSAIEGPIFEYACHEGNYALGNMLAGKRAEEAR